MKLLIDTEANELVITEGGESETIDLFSKQAFETVSKEWLRIGWNQKHLYTFSWMGRPIIQLPDDLMRIQEVIYKLKPDKIIETGVAHGGSLIFYSSICKVIGKGHVVGVDVEIRPHNRCAIESHELYDGITLIEGDSVASDVVAQVKSLVEPSDTVLVILDSNHSYEHVYKELKAYSGLVTVGSYIVATDGIMSDLSDVPRGKSDWVSDNPTCAAKDFVSKNPDFIIEQPVWSFNESELDQNVTHWPGAWLRKL